MLPMNRLEDVRIVEDVISFDPKTNRKHIEDVFDADLFAEILNGAYNPPEHKKVSKEKLNSAATTERIVKQAEALFKLMPEVVEFNHFSPARWLLENPQILDTDSQAIQITLDKAESIFNFFNKLL
jgi:hypothetical protein